ncbi:MAG: VOC family protein [Acidobacteria bacterium]|nr:VOC family protein [Acidobacteriota bacterium]
MDQIDYIELPAENIADLIKTKAFFETVFGWEYQQWGDDYADTKSSGVGSGINAESPSKAPLPVIHVADIEAAYSKVKAAGGAITKEIFSFPGGKRFHFHDPAGNELAAWSE